MIGKTISHYEILEKLGEGGMGVVYKAQDTKLDRLVALKFLPQRLTVSDNDKARFIQEARAASALNHPNILTIYDFNEEGEESFIVMELVEGGSLKSMILAAKEIKTPLPTSRVIDYGFQIAQGLAKAHEKGIVHRDIKCDNIMVTEDGLVKIMDFGLAKLKGAVGLTRTGSTVGTAAYMSPEQVRGEEVDEHADIWAYGVVLFELLTGQLPFRGEHESAMMYSITNEDPKPLEDFRTDIPSQLRQIVERCLQKDRSERYASMSQILEDISKLRPAAGVEVKALSIQAIMNSLKRPAVAVPLVLIILGLGYFTFWYIDRSAKIRWAREKVMPEIERLAGESKWASAYFLAKQIEPVIADDPTFVKLRPSYAARGIIKTDPPGAEVLIAEYGTASDNWVSVGTTPTDTMLLPRGLWRLKLQKQGFVPFDGASSVGLVNQRAIKLDATGSIPENMVRVPGGNYILDIPGLDHLDSVRVGEYLIDRFETTNREYKEFVDHGGYQKEEYWKHPFVKDGRTLTWQEAMKEFVDATGRPGPAIWELGTYPEGKADFPVGGISWYEAAAYAEFRGKSLPTVHHWNFAASTTVSAFIIPASNFDRKGLAPVGKYRGISPYGPVDMGGNVREWCFNASGKQRSILGGGWNDEPYMFTDYIAQPPFDRSPTNGVRCVKVLELEKTSPAAYASIDRDPYRNFLKEKPVSDAVFKIYLSMYKYDRTPLNARIESADTTSDYIMQKISLDAGYGGERLTVFLFVPKVGKPPYQAVVYFPGSGALHTRSSRSLEVWAIDFIVKSGRAVMYPVYKGTYERGTALNSDYPSETSLWKEHMIAWGKDIGRSIDYLESRADIDAKKIAYYGVSWGGMMGPILTAVEKRFKASVLYVAGLNFQRALPEVDAINYVGRVRAPTIMLNGKYDHFFPVETSQKPLFNLLGTPPEHKKYVLYGTGHFVPRNQLIKESLDWLDTYLGMVK
jgi:formylglycine-generating enzyme required for sulfatase activity/tRNA A-37 threonylcarbamoyl transferase component Bud32/dienelactone hydrolase